MQKELTYILGAGASYQSIPIVKTFPNRFNSFTLYLQKIFLDTRFGQEKTDAFSVAYEKAKKIHNAFENHQSFDTYFKKLFHTNQQGKISEAKKILNLYFIWEHLSNSTIRPKNYSETIFWKQSMIDKRYDALVAGLLKALPGKSEPYCPINFITWNYDLNLFMSLKNYFSPNESFEIFLKKINKGGNLWEIDDKISIINMNGYFYCSDIAFLPDINTFETSNLEIHEIMFEKIKGDYFSKNNIDNDAELIKFAWESSVDLSMNELPCVKKAKEKISSSDNIVIIGYTFPLYNRLIDFEYFNGTNLTGKKVYIQDPNALEIKNTLVHDFNITIPSIKMEPRPIGVEYIVPTFLNDITNCESFLIPSDIFKYKDTLAQIIN